MVTEGQPLVRHIETLFVINSQPNMYAHTQTGVWMYTQTLCGSIMCLYL